MLSAPPREGCSFSGLDHLISPAAPLIRHSCGDAGEKAAALFPSIGRRRHVMDAWIAASDDIPRLQWREAAEPEAGTLDLAVPKLPRLHRLRRLLVVGDALLRVTMHHRILDTDALDRRIPEGRE